MATLRGGLELINGGEVSMNSGEDTSISFKRACMVAANVTSEFEIAVEDSRAVVGGSNWVAESNGPRGMMEFLGSPL